MTWGDLLAYEQARRSGRRERRHWLFPFLGLSLALIVMLIFALEGWSHQTYLAWFPLLGLLYVAPGAGAGSMAHEWKADTWYWWLSLPAPREKLLAAKLLGALGRWVRLWLMLLIFAVISMVALDASLQQWSWNLLQAQMRFGGQVGLLGLLLGPPLITLGLVMGSVRRHGKTSFLLIPLWALVILFINIQFNLISNISSMDQIPRFGPLPGQAFAPEVLWHSPWLPVELAAAYVLAGIAFYGLVRWLKHPQ
ncbi:ABC-2 family transporter protein [Peptococcaceae bacterium CEB3]|nr:ABC-2 family transporter protein [Peptococcaceae bacterium CEB3]